MALAALLLAPATVHAHNGEFDGEVYPENEEILSQTPEQVIILSDDPAGVEVTLKRADGSVIYFTGEPVLDADAVSLTPPVLEPGTYILTWKDNGSTETSVFSVDRPDAEVAVTEGSGTLGGLVAALLLAGCALAGLLIGRTRLSVERGALLSVALLPGAAAGWLTLPGTGLDTWVNVTLFSLGGLAIAVGAATGSLRDASRTQRSVWAGTAMLVALTLPAAALIFGSGMLSRISGLAAALVTVLGGLVATAQATRGRLQIVRTVPTLAACLAVVALLTSGGAEIRMVEENTADASRCMSAGNRLEIQRCLEGSFVGIARTNGVNSALKSLEGLIKEQGQARYFCHEVSHSIGRTSLRLNQTLAAAFRDGYDVCDFGYYHGIVEGAAAGLDDAAFRDAVSSLCGEFANAEELFFLQCTHGLGHAAARRTNNDMLRALEFCDAIDDQGGLAGARLANARNGCGTGVTMEWFATATISEDPPVTPKVEEPRDVCHQVPAEWAAECYEYVGNTLDAADPVNSLRELGTWCTGSPQTGPCYKGLARAAAGVGISDRDAISVCDTATNPADRDGCVTYYIATVATTIDFSVTAVEEICALLPARDRDGESSLCAKVRTAVEQVLASGDGK
jgi:hypothetical protein